MQNILCYDTDYEKIESLSDKYDLPTWEIIEMLLDYEEDMIKDNYLEKD